MQFLNTPVADRLRDAPPSSLPFFSSLVDVDHVLVTVSGDGAAAPVVVVMSMPQPIGMDIKTASSGGGDDSQ